MSDLGRLCGCLCAFVSFLLGRVSGVGLKLFNFRKVSRMNLLISPYNQDLNVASLQGTG